MMIMMSRTLVSQSQYGLAGLLRSQLPFGFSFYLLSAPPSFFSGEHMGEDGDDDDRLASGLLSCLLSAVPSSTLVSTWVMEVQYKTCCCTFLLPIFPLALSDGFRRAGSSASLFFVDKPEPRKPLLWISYWVFPTWNCLDNEGGSLSGNFVDILWSLPRLIQYPTAAAKRKV